MNESVTSQKNTLRGYGKGLSYIAMGLPLLAACAPVTIIIGGSPASQDLGKLPTMVPTTPYSPLNTPTPESRGRQCNLWQFYAQDYVNAAHPSLNVAEVEQKLRAIAAQIPVAIPFQAGDCQGLVPNPATGGVEKRPQPFRMNAPEGGYAYISTGNDKLEVEGKQYTYPYKEGRVYLQFVMGVPDDHGPEDKNTNFGVSDFPAGHIYINLADPQQNQEFPTRNVIDRTWFAQQLLWASQSGSNCGVGCQKEIIVAFIDAQTGGEYLYKVDPATLAWQTVTSANVRGK